MVESVLLASLSVNGLSEMNNIHENEINTVNDVSNDNGNGNLRDGHSNQDLEPRKRPSLWYEDEISDSLRLCFGLNSILHKGASKYQDIALVDTDPFGKVLVIDNKIQSAEADEWVYHEALVHPALLHHSSPKNVFIMGGGEGSTAREVLRHGTVVKVVMCDIDKDVVSFCSTYLSANRDAFRSSRLELVIKDARIELQNRKEQYDVVIGDLADPVIGGPCYQLYTKDFYENIIKTRLADGGIFVTQAGPAGVLSYQDVFSSIFNTLRSVFKYVIPYATHIPSYADTWGWVMASDKPFPSLSPDELNAKMKCCIDGELQYLDGETWASISILNKAVRRSLAKETHIYVEDDARFIHGRGIF